MQEFLFFSFLRTKALMMTGDEDGGFFSGFFFPIRISGDIFLIHRVMICWRVGMLRFFLDSELDNLHSIPRQFAFCCKY